VKAQSKMQEIRQKAAADGYLARVDADGGFMIAPEFSTALLDATLETAVVRPLARKITLGSSSIKLPQYKNYDHSSNVFGGLIAYWKGENAQLTAVHGNLEEVGLELNPLTVLCAVSHQMMKFSPESVGSWLLPQMAATVAWTEDKGFISGNGAGQPLGILNAGCTVSQAIESGQVLSTGAIVTENILKMSARHRVENPASVAWLYNKADLLPWLGKLSIVVGVGGSAVGLVSRMTDSPQLMLMGNPLKETEHTKAAGTVGDIILIDGSQYIVADDRTGPEVAQSVDLYFDYGQSCFRLIKYVDGQPRYRTYFTKANGTNTIAPFLTLAARSN
jgi:HK97 family phage major capsid protein